MSYIKHTTVRYVVLINTATVISNRYSPTAMPQLKNMYSNRDSPTFNVLTDCWIDLKRGISSALKSNLLQGLYDSVESCVQQSR